ESQHLAQITLIALGPQVRLLGRIDELRGDAYAILRTQHRPLYDRVYAQLLRNLGQWSVNSLVLHCGSARDHAQLPDLGQRGNEGLGESVSEILLLGVSRQIFKRQDSKGFNAVNALCEASYKAVTPPRERLDKAGSLRRVVQRVPQAHHGCIEPLLKVHERAVGPEPLLQALPGYYFTGVLEEDRQQLEGLLR